MAPCGRTSDLARLAPPDRVMAVPRTDKRMRNLVKDGVADMVGFGMTDVMARQGNGAVRIIALAGAPSRVVKLDLPAVQTVMTHEVGSRFKRCLKRPVSWLHAARAI